VKGGPALKPSRFTEEQIAFALNQAQFATSIEEVSGLPETGPMAK